MYSKHRTRQVHIHSFPTLRPADQTSPSCGSVAIIGAKMAALWRELHAVQQQLNMVAGVKQAHCIAQGIFRRFISADHQHCLTDMAGQCGRSEEHTSELQSLMRISYAVFCLKKQNNIHKVNRTSKHTKYNHNAAQIMTHTTRKT